MDRNEVEEIIKILAFNNKEYISAFLADHDLPKSGDKEELIERIRKGVKDGQIDPAEIVAFVDEIEGWGSQRAYLYRVNDGLCAKWRAEKHVKEVLRSNKALSLLNAGKPIILPNKTTLSTINWDGKRLKFVWITKAQVQKRLEEHDEYDEKRDIYLRAYRTVIKRGILVFELDLLTGEAMLLLQRMHSDKLYDSLRDQILKKLEPFLDIAMLEPVKLSKIIQKLEDSKELRVRRQITEATNGLRADYRSKSKNHDTKKLENYQKSKKALGPSRGYFGNFYWETCDEIKKEIHTNLYANSNSLLIFSQHPESEIRHVIGRIRSCA